MIPSMHGASIPLPPWQHIDTVLIDLDGTLLDLSFDNWFWLERVPHAYALAKGLDPEAARAQLGPMYEAHEGTLSWYCIDHWSRELALDIRALKRAEGRRIGWLPGARDWLESLGRAGKRRIIVTNAHPDTFQIKDERTGVSRHVDGFVSSHRVGAAKEDPRFWRDLDAHLQFDRDRSLFVDDTLSVLRAARNAGIRWTYAVRAEPMSEFPTVTSVADLAVPNAT
jgi:HAD superfamily hydrolase (TIGR01509 family)